MSMSTNDHYSVLGVAIDASQEELRTAYRHLAKSFHPDVNPDGAERFREATRAYQVLSDPTKRKHYDAGDSPADDDSLSVDDLNAYYDAVRPFIGSGLLDVGLVQMQIETEIMEHQPARGLLFVGSNNAVFIDARARAGHLHGRVAPIAYSALMAPPELNDHSQGSVIRLIGSEDEDYVAYIAGAAPLLGVLKSAASRGYQATRDHTSPADRVTDVSRTTSPGISRGRIAGWVMVALIIFGLVSQLLTAIQS